MRHHSTSSALLLSCLVLAATLLGASVAEAQLYTGVRVYRPVRVSPTVYAPATSPRTSLRSSGIRSQTQTHPDVELEPLGPGQVGCEVRDNRILARGLMEVRRQGRVIATGRCGSALELPGGRYDVTLTLLDALDRPQRTVPVVVPEGGSVTARARFETAILEVRVTKDGVRMPGTTQVYRDGARVGSIGSGVTFRVSPGRYHLLTRYRRETKTFDVDLSAGQRRAIRAAF